MFASYVSLFFGALLVLSSALCIAVESGGAEGAGVPRAGEHVV